MDRKWNDLKDKFTLVDTHNDTMMHVVDEETWLPRLDIGQGTDLHIDIGKLEDGGIDIAYFAAFNEGFNRDTEKSLSSTLSLINALYFTEEKNRGRFKIIRELGDIEELLGEGKRGALPTIEGAYAFDGENSEELLNQFLDLGVRVIAFTWNYSNHLAEGISETYGEDLDEKSPEGLTSLGKKMIENMNNLGMVVDVSHMSKKSFWDTIETSKSPIIASHSGVDAIRNHPRNLDDEQLKALAKNGGVVGIVLSKNFLTDKETGSVKDFVDHVDYAVDLIGEDHVGIGSDFDGTTIPEDIKNSSEMYKIVDEMFSRGYEDKSIEKILGGNMLRVLRKGSIEEREEDKGANLTLDFPIGGKLKDPCILKVNIKDTKDIKEEASRIILDGITYSGELDRDNKRFFLKLDEALKERFHVVTFELAYKDGREDRLTRIFYNE